MPYARFEAGLDNEAVGTRAQIDRLLANDRPQLCLTCKIAMLECLITQQSLLCHFRRRHCELIRPWLTLASCFPQSDSHDCQRDQNSVHIKSVSEFWIVRDVRVLDAAGMKCHWQAVVLACSQ